MMTNLQDSIARFPDCSLGVQQLDFGARNHEAEASARKWAYRDQSPDGFPGDLCYPLGYLALGHFVMENGLDGIFQNPPYAVRSFGA